MHIENNSPCNSRKGLGITILKISIRSSQSNSYSYWTPILITCGLINGTLCSAYVCQWHSPSQGIMVTKPWGLYFSYDFTILEKKCLWSWEESCRQFMWRTPLKDIVAWPQLITLQLSLESRFRMLHLSVFQMCQDKVNLLSLMTSCNL